MTKREALEKSIEMWTWIDENCADEKSEYFVDKQDVQHDCYLCEYVKERLEDPTGRFKIYPSCVKNDLCPVKNWSLLDHFPVESCVDEDSPYSRYEDDRVLAYQIAANMLYILRRELDNLEDEDE